MSTRLFVGGLSWETGDADLRAAFEGCGAIVEAKVITDRDTGRSRGFGFVTFESAEAARQAIESLNDTELDGRTIRVDAAQEKSRRR